MNSTESRGAFSSTAFRFSRLNLEIQPGELVMIVGTVGSGKSSLLSGVLGEMPLVSGSMDVTGRLAYVSQEAWIRNMSLRENILFDTEFDKTRYEHVLKATQLLLDLNSLPNGDSTEIGERGINLSGGQKARVAIARAMYCQDYDILILDDPLSAVDPHVAHAIFNQCVVGLAVDKTRLLVVNSHYDLLECADRVLVIENGEIAGNGSYEDIVAQFPQFRVQQKNGSLNDSPEEPVAEFAMPRQDTGILRETEEVYVDGSDEVDEHQDVERLVQEEDRVRGSVSGKTYRTYFDETGFDGIAVILVLLLAYAASQGIRVVVDWWPSHWAKNMTHRYGIDPTYSGTVFGMWYLGIIVVCVFATLGRALLLVELGVRSSKRLHNKLFRRVLRAPITRYFDITPIGRVLNRFSNDLDQIDAILPQQFQLLFQNTTVCIGSLVVAAFASYWIAISYIPVAALFAVIGLYFKKTSAEVKRLEGITRTPVYNLFSETLAGLSTIRAFKRQELFVKWNKERIDTNTSLYLTYWSVGRWLAVRLDLLSVLVISVVSLYLVATRGQLSATISGLALSYALMLASQVQWVMRAVDRADNAMTSVERMLHFLTIPSESDAEDCEPDWEPSRGGIEFDAVCLRYRPELPLVLQGVTMHIKAGEKIGICGRTGAGKSSLMIALFRICDFDSGRVCIDGIDIQRVKLRDLRRGLAIIPQDPVLYSGTLRDNVDPFHEHSDEAIWAALRHVHLALTVANKWGGSGLDFRVAEGGENLSVGQRQLLCISRALLKGSKIVVLDEATASVDKATDELIQATIREAFADMTVMVIAHRIDTIMHCDKIVVMNAGRVAEFASPTELLSNPQSIFSSLAYRSAVK